MSDALDSPRATDSAVTSSLARLEQLLIWNDAAAEEQAVAKEACQEQGPLRRRSSLFGNRHDHVEELGRKMSNKPLEKKASELLKVNVKGLNAANESILKKISTHASILHPHPEDRLHTQRTVRTEGKLLKTEGDGDDFTLMESTSSAKSVPSQHSYEEDAPAPETFDDKYLLHLLSPKKEKQPDDLKD